VSDESEIQISPSRSPLNISTGRSDLIARGRSEAAAMKDPLFTIRLLAEQGDADAIADLSYSYWKGEEAPVDHSEALKWLSKAGAKGHYPEIDVGILHYNSGHYYEAVKCVKQHAADCGSEFGPVELYLGKCYFYGAGVQRDYAEAARWLLASMDDEACYLLDYIYTIGLWNAPVVIEKWDFPSAAYAEDLERNRRYDRPFDNFCLGLAYAYGRGLPQDNTEAAKWFRKAADGGDVHAGFHLGVAHAYGRGVSQDYVKAHIWLTVACSNAGIKFTDVGPVRDDRLSGIQEMFTATRDFIARKMTPDQLAEARSAPMWREVLALDSDGNPLNRVK